MNNNDNYDDDDSTLYKANDEVDYDFFRIRVFTYCNYAELLYSSIPISQQQQKQKQKQPSLLSPNTHKDDGTTTTTTTTTININININNNNNTSGGGGGGAITSPMKSMNNNGNNELTNGKGVQVDGFPHIPLSISRKNFETSFTYIIEAKSYASASNIPSLLAHVAYHIGMWHYMQEHYEEAKTQFYTALAYDDNHVLTLVQLGKLYHLMGTSFPQQSTSSLSSNKEEVKDGRCFINTATTQEKHMNMERRRYFDKAYGYLQNAIRINNMTTSAWYYRGMVLQDLHLPSSNAANSLLKHLELDSTSPCRDFEEISLLI